MLSTRLCLVRHGATVLTAEDRFAGATDVQLSDESRGQAQRLSERLAGERIDAAYCSPMDRTVETSRLIVAPHALEPQPCDGLRETHHGHWSK